MAASYSQFRQQPDRSETVTFGGSYKDVLSKELDKLDVKKVYLVVSKSLAGNSSELEQIQNVPAVKKRLAGTKVGVRPHGDLDDVVEIINTVRDLSIDCVITMGAGSISDACKNVKFGLSHNVKTKEDFLKLKAKIVFETGSLELPDVTLNSLSLKLICIPTSLSAGEYNPASGSLDRATGKKVPYYHTDSMPDLIICDPYLATKTPEWVWMSTGVRSIDHAVETITNINVDLKNPYYLDAIEASKEALVLLMEGLILTKEDENNVGARDMCQRGAWKASLAIVRKVPMGASHAIGHILGYVGGVAHGHTSCVCMPAVQRFNYKVTSKQQDEIRDLLVSKGIAKKLGLGNEKDPQCWQLLLAFIKYIGMPSTLEEVNVKRDQWERIAKETMTDFWSKTNPIPLDTPEQAMEILQMIGKAQ